MAVDEGVAGAEQNRGARQDTDCRRPPSRTGKPNANSHATLGWPGRLAELDGPLLFLVADASSYVTGQTLLVDGGWTTR